ncbi:MAG: virulence RhuM family protein, partial [Rickettsiales bacterium]|nr:virulence RhuM family protein [Rickettsiales bacterium]
MSDKQEMIIYSAEDGRTKVSVRLQDGNIWLSQAQMAELFQTTKQNIALHIQNIFDEGELLPDATVKEYLTVQTEGSRQVSRNIAYYNLQLIIALGYRVKSRIGTQFRRWATDILSEYAVKGFTLNDELLKSAAGGGYWRELLARIRDIRSSERVFYRQILDIYATSMDYDPNAPETLEFFKIVQNKMHFAAHGHTAAEIQYLRANASQPFMGLQTWTGVRPQKTDVVTAKNYLDGKELDV